MMALVVPVSSWAEESGEDYCVIPKLEPGIATVVKVSDINKTFCGVAQIDKRFVKLDQFAPVREEDAPHCASNRECTKEYRFFKDAEKQTAPYILVFKGPRPNPS